MDFVGSRLLLWWFDAIYSMMLVVELMEYPVVDLLSAALF